MRSSKAPPQSAGGEDRHEDLRHSWDPRVSFAIPVFNEEELIDLLVSRLRGVLDSTPGGPHEVVIVDDGSTDSTLERLHRATRDDPRFVIVSLARNFGHQAAITAGLETATGDVVLVIDGDLQDPPESLPRFLEKWRDGYDVVYAIRTKRKEGILLRTAYFLFYRLILSLSSVRLPLDSGDFSLLTREVVDTINSLPERNRYVRGLRSWVGFRQIGLEIERSARAAGEAKYNLRRLIQLALDGIFSFSVAPLRAASLLGALAVALSSIYAGYALVARFLLDRSPQGFTALIFAIVFLSGVQLLFLGVLGEYLGRIYHEVKQRPNYVVRGGPPESGKHHGSSVR